MFLPNVTVIVTQRERFSLTQPSLESILADYDAYPFQLIYVDGNSPHSIQQYLQAKAQQHPYITLIRQERYLRSNEARNLALPFAQSADYLVFLDNDVVVEPGWLRALVTCAETEQAAIVVPLVLQGQPRSPDIEVHVAGIKTKFHFRKRGKRWFEQEQLLYGAKLSDVEASLQRTVVDAGEFHCLLAKGSYMKSVVLDEMFDSLASHTDLCFQIQSLGGHIVLEPSSKVIFLNPKQVPIFTRDDLPFYWFKWNDRFVQQNFNHAIQKWNLDKHDPSIRSIWKWVIENRQIPAQLSVSQTSLLDKLLQMCRHQRCPSLLRMLMERLVLEVSFPKSGIQPYLESPVIPQINAAFSLSPNALSDVGIAVHT